MKTRRVKKGGAGIFNVFKRKNQTSQPTSVKPITELNRRKQQSKSRVANILQKPGAVVYTNKQRIENEYAKEIAILKEAQESPVTKSGITQFQNSLQQAMQSEEAKKTGSFVIKIPVFIGKVLYSLLKLFLFIGIALFSLVGLDGNISTFNSINSTAAASLIMQNNTTKNNRGARVEKMRTNSTHFVNPNVYGLYNSNNDEEYIPVNNKNKKSGSVASDPGVMGNIFSFFA